MIFCLNFTSVVAILSVVATIVGLLTIGVSLLVALKAGLLNSTVSLVLATSLWLLERSHWGLAFLRSLEVSLLILWS